MPSPSEAQAILDRLDRAIEEVAAAAKAAIDLVRAKDRETAARTGDDDEWTRLPGRKDKCRITGWSRSKLYRLKAVGVLRMEKRVGTVFYSGADIRKVQRGEVVPVIPSPAVSAPSHA